jgi:hypothetical protein
MRKTLLAFVLALFSVLLAASFAFVGAGCTSILGNFDVVDGGGGDGAPDGKADTGHDATPGNDAPSASFTIGGHVTGLSGAGLVLLDNGGNALHVSAGGSFTFTSGLANGATYDVTVGTQPTAPTQNCVVKNGNGKVVRADVKTVLVECTTATFTISGTLSHLLIGDTVVLTDNGGDTLSINANGIFTFDVPVEDGTPYAVVVKTQPSNSTDTCYVSLGTGKVMGGPVTNVAVTCSDCGRFSKGVTASAWTTVAANPFGVGMFLSEYLPPGPATGPTFYAFNSNTMNADSFNAATNVYTTLPAPFVSLAGYSSFAWYNNSLWSMDADNLVEYDIASASWSLPSSALAGTGETETTVDNAGNLWGFQSETVLNQYNVGTGVLTAFTLPTGLAGSGEPRIVYDGCSELLYVADFLSTAFYSYDPATNTQTVLSSPPSSNLIQDGFCSDRSGHIFLIDNGTTPFQYDIATDTWVALPAGPLGANNSACGVGADGNLYATDPNVSTMMYQIPIQ